MKKFLLVLLALVLVLAFTACGGDEEENQGQNDPPSGNEQQGNQQGQDQEQEDPAPPVDDLPTVFLWNNFANRDPHNNPGTSANGAPIWWDNWANLRASSDDSGMQLQFRPGEFDPEDYDDMDDFFARATDWMSNWGEAVDMWSLDYISYCRYMTIRMRGLEGGEENKILLHFVPNDGPVFAARFSDLVARGGGNVQITTEMQDVVIDLQASGFPGMTNRMHIRAFYECTIFIEEIYFHEPRALIDSTDNDTIAASFTVEPIGSITDLNIRGFVATAAGIFPWNNFAGRDPHNRPERSVNGAPIWWDNWANLRANAEGDYVRIEFRPGAFDPEDFDDYDDFFARANDWMGNWGEAIDMWSLDNISYTRYMTIRMRGAEGGEENRIMLHFQPNDGPSFVARFSDLVVRGGGNVEIITETQDIVIDLQASGFPGMTNRMHIRAFAECTIHLYEIYFHGVVGPIDTSDNDTIHAGFTVEPIGNPADLPIREFIDEL